MSLPPRFEITEDQIAQVVAAFYEAVRHHPGLGPVFAVHVTDWPAHEAKVAAFWANAILYAPGYDGNPFAVHRDAGNVRPGMFDPWLALFDATLRRELPSDTAAAWSALAHKIGRSLRAGVSEVPKRGQPPILR
ncbi:MAG: globin family protein [Rhodobacterales bacterium]|nr:MAG: globin family protein [Rhodobacterales bacterium]